MARRHRPAPPVDQNRVETTTPFSQSVNRRVRGTTVNCDTNGHMYLVATAQGRVAMPRKRAFPGDVGLIPNGTPVIVDYSLGEPYIDGILPPENPRHDANVSSSITGTSGHGGQDEVLSANLGANARGETDPNDLLPGDSVLNGPDGSKVGALHGKVGLLFGSALAQVRAFGDSDLVQIVSGLLHVITWMGESKVINEDGKTSFIWRGGSDQLSQTGADEEHYPIRLDVGHTGDLVRFEITTPRGQTLFSLHINGQGRCSVFAGGGFDVTNTGDDAPVRNAGSRDVRVLRSDSLQVSGEATRQFDSNRRTSVSNNDRELIGQDRFTSITRRWVLDVGGATEHTFNDNVTVNVRNSAYTMNITGRTIFSSTLPIELKTVIPDGVKLGRDPRFHAVKYETLNQRLEALVTDYNTFKRAVALHVHPVAGSVAGSAPALAPMSAPYVLGLEPAKSQDVLL